MRIPRRLKVGPHLYKVSYMKKMGLNHGALGQSRHVNGEIVLDPEQIRSQIDQTFLHEVLHCIDWQIKCFSTDDNENEKQIEQLSNMLLQVIQDNPQIFNNRLVKNGKKSR